MADSRAMPARRFTMRTTTEAVPAPSQQQGQKFLDELPDVEMKDLQQNEEEGATCHICTEVFDNGTRAGAEAAVKLPCGHVLGRKCMSRWLGTNNSCPMCRRVLFQSQRPPQWESSSSRDPRIREANAIAMRELHAIRRSVALVQSELDHLERVNTRLGFDRRREAREVERQNDVVEARLRDLCVRFPDLAGSFGDQIRW